MEISANLREAVAHRNVFVTMRYTNGRVYLLRRYLVSFLYRPRSALTATEDIVLSQEDKPKRH